MAESIKVSPEEMIALGKETVEKAIDLQTQIDSLIKNKDSLMAIWSGEAANTFEQAFTSQMTNLRDFKNLIEELGSRIDSGGNEYGENEQKNIDDAKRLFDQIDG